MIRPIAPQRTSSRIDTTAADNAEVANLTERTDKNEAVSAMPITAGGRELALLAVGFGCMIGYSRMLSLGFTGFLSDGVISSVDTWYVLRSCICLGILALLAIAGWKRWFRLGPPLLVVATVAAIGAALVFALDGTGSFRWLVALTGGAGIAVLMYVWMLLLSRFEPRVIAAVSMGGLLIAGAIIVGAPRLDANLALTVAAIAAFLTGATALLLDPGLSSCIPDGPLRASQAARVPWLTVIMVLVCGFLATITFGIAEHLTWLYDWSPNYIAFFSAIVIVLAATLVPMARMDSWVHLAWIPQFALLIVALAFSCFSVRASIQIAVGCLLAAVFCTHFLHWAIFPGLFSTIKVPRSFLAGAMLFCANGSLATVLGDALGGALPHSMQNLGGVAGLAVITLAMVFIVTFLVYRHASGSTGLIDSLIPRAALETDGAGENADAEKTRAGGANTVAVRGQDMPPADDAGNAPLADASRATDLLDTLQRRIDGISSEYGLTPHEREVAFLTVQGFSCAYIADKLVVSESTVRFHQKNLYKKLDVHSRNKFIELVGQHPSE